MKGVHLNKIYLLPNLSIMNIANTVPIAFINVSGTEYMMAYYADAELDIVEPNPAFSRTVGP